MTTLPHTTAGEELLALLETMRRLRDPVGGCPWDVEQTHRSLQPTMLEESYEAMEALGSGEPQRMVEELGDLLIQVVFHAQIGVDIGTFSITDVIRQANRKLVRRHPHVFGDTGPLATAAEVKAQWDLIKADEREERGEGERSALEGVPRSMPALAYAQAVQERSVRAGLEPLEGNPATVELTKELSAQRARTEEGMGELLFALVALARQSGIQAEAALRSVNSQFYRRFAAMERLCRERGVPVQGISPEERALFWQAATKAAGLA